MNGQYLFEKLMRMTEDERRQLVFPGFFNHQDADTIVSETINNADLTEEEYDKASRIDNKQMMQFIYDAVGKNYETWTDEYVQKIYDDTADSLLAYARQK